MHNNVKIKWGCFSWAWLPQL